MQICYCKLRPRYAFFSLHVLHALRLTDLYFFAKITRIIFQFLRYLLHHHHHPRISSSKSWTKLQGRCVSRITLMSMLLWPIVCVAIWSAEQFCLQCMLECPQRRQRRDRRRQRIPNLCRGNGEGTIANGPVQRPWNMQRWWRCISQMPTWLDVYVYYQDNTGWRWQLPTLLCLQSRWNWCWATAISQIALARRLVAVVHVCTRTLPAGTLPSAIGSRFASLPHNR